ncbi:MAG: hypothetical protein COB20_03465 [SAR86 cluster bacterium]|uniref:Uncharacterized protein n=1 Tax=SAR86 cluster bacterium TaxID=2030880 RepID=A0A2A4XDZ5_9GAMM|nr:MAG: hypothetical protein COB20_03465 [SAR86 cluster bacterium]
MNHRVVTALNLALASLLIAPALIAQSSDIPRTEFGTPDFQGTYTYRTLTPLNRPPELADKEVLTVEEAIEWQQFENRRQDRDLIIDSVGGAGYPPGVISYNNFWYERGIETIADRRTSLVYDPPNGRMPAMNASGQKRRAEIAEMRRLSLGPEGRTLADRCLQMGGLPMTSGAYNNNMQLIQTKDHIVIVNEMIHRARIIRLDSEHHTRQLKWSGDSIAHWEGDTLVIHTQHFYQNQNGRGSSASMQLEERLSWIDENTLDYDFTMQDPETWDVSWSARLPMRRIEDPLFEYACHEGNHGLPGILAGWRRYESMGMNGDGTAKE